MTSMLDWLVEADPSGEGPYVQIWLIVMDGVIREAAFKCPDCPSSTASAGVLCALVRGRPVEKALALNSEDLLAVVGGLPDGKGHYVDRAIRAMQLAVKSCELAVVSCETFELREGSEEQKQ